LTQHLQNQSEQTAVEVWLNDGDVETVNNLGEGLPLEDMAWPWPEDGGKLA
jgi:hypothetical protein